MKILWLHLLFPWSYFLDLLLSFLSFVSRSPMAVSYVRSEAMSKILFIQFPAFLLMLEEFLAFLNLVILSFLEDILGLVGAFLCIHPPSVFLLFSLSGNLVLFLFGMKGLLAEPVVLFHVPENFSPILYFWYHPVYFWSIFS